MHNVKAHPVTVSPIEVTLLLSLTCTHLVWLEVGPRSEGRELCVHLVVPHRHLCQVCVVCLTLQQRRPTSLGKKLNKCTTTKPIEYIFQIHMFYARLRLPPSVPGHS